MGFNERTPIPSRRNLRNEKKRGWELCRFGEFNRELNTRPDLREFESFFVYSELYYARLFPSRPRNLGSE